MEKALMENNIKKCKKQHKRAQINRELASLISIFKNKINQFAVRTLINKKATLTPLTINKTSANSNRAARWCSGQA
jgi:hypothetical protein